MAGVEGHEEPQGAASSSRSTVTRVHTAGAGSALRQAEDCVHTGLRGGGLRGAGRQGVPTPQRGLQLQLSIRHLLQVLPCGVLTVQRPKGKGRPAQGGDGVGGEGGAETRLQAPLPALRLDDFHDGCRARWGAEPPGRAFISPSPATCVLGVTG